MSAPERDPLERFVGEPVTPEVDSCDTSAMAIGEPGVPRRFRWREETVAVTTVLRSWRQTGRCRHGSPEMYVRKHWFEIVDSRGRRMKIYFERQARRGQKGSRWWLFSVGASP